MKKDVKNAGDVSGGGFSDHTSCRILNQLKLYEVQTEENYSNQSERRLDYERG